MLKYITSQTFAYSTIHQDLLYKVCTEAPLYLSQSIQSKFILLIAEDESLTYIKGLVLHIKIILLKLKTITLCNLIIYIKGNNISNITEIAPDTYRISTFIPELNMQFNQFLIKDDEPLLYHTGMKGLFPLVKDAVAKIIDPSTIKWIGFSHFEADECGALSEWQQTAPDSTAVCSIVSKLVNVDDVVAERPARPLEDNEVINTGKYRFKFIQTPHVPH